MLPILPDTVARIGGDEFAVILRHISGPQTCTRIAGNIRAAVAAPFRPNEHDQEIRIGASIGIAIYPLDGDDEDRLVDHADTAMYKAKLHGSGVQLFSEGPPSLADSRARVRDSELW